MELSFRQTISFSATLLLIAAITQSIYTGFYVYNEVAEANVQPPRQLLWGFEGFLFTMLAAVSGAAMIQAKRFHLGWSAIAVAAILNIVQVGVGLTLFIPFREAAGEVEALDAVATAIVAFSFMVYNSAKALIALAAIVFGMAKLGEGSKMLGGATALIGVIAFVTNALSMAMGRDFSGDVPLAGGSGVLATVLLAVCLFRLRSAE